MKFLCDFVEKINGGQSWKDNLHRQSSSIVRVVLLQGFFVCTVVSGPSWPNLMSDGLVSWWLVCGFLRGYVFNLFYERDNTVNE